MPTDMAKIVKELHHRFAKLSKAKREALQKSVPDIYRNMYAAWVNIEGRKDFWFFLKHVLRNPVLYAPLHKSLADWLLDENWEGQKKMLLMPRGHVKSNIITGGYAVWRIVRDPNVRILLGSLNAQDAARFLAPIKAYIKDDEWFR